MATDTTSSSSASETVNAYEEMFKHRYTEEDEEFMKTASRPLAPPPCVTGWFTKRRNDWGRRGGHDSRNWREGNRQSQKDWNHGDGGQHGGYRDNSGYRDRRYDNQGARGDYQDYGGHGNYHDNRGQYQRYRE